MLFGENQIQETKKIQQITTLATCWVGSWEEEHKLEEYLRSKAPANGRIAEGQANQKKNIAALHGLNVGKKIAKSDQDPSNRMMSLPLENIVGQRIYIHRLGGKTH